MCYSTISIQTKKGRINVDCGKCAECLQKRRSQWTFRLMAELRVSQSALFLTLTYSDENLPGDRNLKKRDFQNFMKRLRKSQSSMSNVQLRYYAVGEYGEHTNRPHYHAILFNLDKRLIEKIEDIWQLGNIQIGDVNQASIHYVTKYMLQPKDENIKEPPFALMSRRPYLGHSYLNEQTKLYHKKHEVQTVSHIQGSKIAMPKVYKEKLYPNKTKVKFKKLKFDYYVPAKNITRDRLAKVSLDQAQENEEKKRLLAEKRKKNYELLMQKNRLYKTNKMKQQSKSKKV